MFPSRPNNRDAQREILSGIRIENTPIPNIEPTPPDNQPPSFPGRESDDDQETLGKDCIVAPLDTASRPPFGVHEVHHAEL